MDRMPEGHPNVNIRTVLQIVISNRSPQREAIHTSNRCLLRRIGLALTGRRESKLDRTIPVALGLVFIWHAAQSQSATRSKADSPVGLAQRLAIMFGLNRLAPRDAVVNRAFPNEYLPPYTL